MLKKICLIVASSLIFSACSLTPSATPSPTPIPSINSPTSMPTPTTTSSVDNNQTMVAITTKNGQIVAQLYASETPNTVKNFLSKAKSGFYKGLTFHRVIDGFMAQGGDPTGTGTGGGQIKSEINNIPFKRGSFGLARTPVTKEISNDSQFFICFTTEGCQHLTSDYVNFGEVVSGFDVLDKIKQGDLIISITTATK